MFDCIATAVVGYFLYPMGLVARVMMAGVGLLLLYQSTLTNIIGLALLVAIVAPEYLFKRCSSGRS